MKITKIKGTNIELTPEIKLYTQDKMDMLDKYLGNVQILNCDVEVGLTSKHHSKGDIYFAEVGIEVSGEILRVEKTEKELFKAIDKVKDHLARSIKRYKEKKLGIK